MRRSIICLSRTWFRSSILGRKYERCMVNRALRQHYQCIFRLKSPINNGEFSRNARFKIRWSSSSVTSQYKTGSVQDFLSSLTNRDKALLEQSLFEAFEPSTTSSHPGHPVDPILQKEIGSLGWVRSIRIEKSHVNYEKDYTIPTKETQMHSSVSMSHTIQVTLKVSRLHPSLDIVKSRISEYLATLLFDLSLAMGWNIVPSPSSCLSMTTTNAISFKIQPITLLPFFIQALERSNASEAKNRLKNLGPGLQNVSHFVAVYSCKGGVGKSTIAVNLAYELAFLGARVGLIDVDIYGPSLPTLVKLDDYKVRRSPLGAGMILPLQHRGVKMISLGFVSPSSGVPGSGISGGPAVLRGPMASKVVTQLLKGTDWGDLDVLIMDLPPGTGDVQLTVCQEISLSGVVTVFTPSLLAWHDAQKGIEMFTSMGVRVICAVENMAYFESSDGSRHYPFGNGKSHNRNLYLKDARKFQIPISAKINDCNDNGTPISLKRQEDAYDEVKIFQSIGHTVAAELFLLQEHGNERPIISMVSFQDMPNVMFDLRSMQLNVDNTEHKITLRFYSDNGAYLVELSGAVLYSETEKISSLESPCEKGQRDQSEDLNKGQRDQSEDLNKLRRDQSEDLNKVSDDEIFPCRAYPKGDGYMIHWANGLHGSYSNQVIAKVAGAKSIEDSVDKN